MTPEVTTIPRKMSLEEYLTYDDGTDRSYELDDGYLILIPPATGQHTLIISFLVTYFTQAIQQQKVDLFAYASGVEFLTSPQQPIVRRNSSLTGKSTWNKY